METDSELLENIIACRTCGIHYVTPTKYQLKHLFQSPLENSEIMLIRLELAQWNVEVAENDGFPQHVCNTCIHKFEQVFELRAACINAQNEFRKFYNVPNGNVANIKIKTEAPDRDEEEQPICDFIYVDDLSDTEYDGATPFNIPHVPIKEEVIEAATIPMEEAAQQPTNMVKSASEIVVQSDTTSSHLPEMMQQNESTAASTAATVIVQVPVEQVECKLCQHLSSSQEDHKQHMQRAHEIRDMDCHICGKEFKNSTPARLKFHMKWHTLNKHVKCTLCGFVCSSRDALKEHKRANHGKIYCKICGKGVLAKKMKSHLRQHELLPKFPCEYCTQAFATENERENHIWQIHANEDNNRSSITIPALQTGQEMNENLFSEQQTEPLLCPDLPDEDILNYKFLCAHCDQRFMEQIDLETHVNEVHRSNKDLTTAEQKLTSSIIEETTEMMQREENDDNGHTNITVFEDYDNDEEIHVPVSDSILSNNTLTTTQDMATNSNLVTQTEHMDESEENENPEHSEVGPEYHNETASNTSSSEEEQSDDDTASEDESTTNLPAAFVENNLNAFACAKCSETFVTIEQLREHHEQHLAADQQQKTPTKSQFKCNLCGKTFDLKFSLNRHVKKHKTAPI